MRGRSGAGIELVLDEVALPVTAHDQALILEDSQRLCAVDFPTWYSWATVTIGGPPSGLSLLILLRRKISQQK